MIGLTQQQFRPPSHDNSCPISRNETQIFYPNKKTVHLTNAFLLFFQVFSNLDDTLHFLLPLPDKIRTHKKEFVSSYNIKKVGQPQVNCGDIETDDSFSGKSGSAKKDAWPKKWSLSSGNPQMIEYHPTHKTKNLQEREEKYPSCFSLIRCEVRPGPISSAPPKNEDLPGHANSTRQGKKTPQY